MSFHVCYYHVIWTTKNRAPWVGANMERQLIEAITEKSQNLKSHVECVNGCMNHVHVAVQINVTLAVSEWVRQIKGYSSFAINRLYPDLPQRFQWQESYGILTFGRKQLPFVVSYIEQQKQHHKMQTTHAYLEKTGDEDEE